MFQIVFEEESRCAVGHFEGLGGGPDTAEGRDCLTVVTVAKIRTR
jgi:hypothetical protein